MIYLLSFLIILSPIFLAYVLTAGISRRSKLLIVVVSAAVILILPIMVFWLYGGSAF